MKFSLPAPNRLAVYAVSLAALATALAPAFLDIGLPQVAAISVSVATFAGIVGVWLKGWQATEKVVQQDELHQRITTREAAAAAEARAQTNVRTGSNLKLPR